MNKIEIMIRPRDSDVLFGRGKPFQKHTGNMRMKATVEPYAAIYQSAPRHLKTAITKHVIRIIRESAEDQEFTADFPDKSSCGMKGSFMPIRFLKQNLNYQEDDDDREPRWIEATDEEIFNKISHCLRKKEFSSKSSEIIQHLASQRSGFLSSVWPHDDTSMKHQQQQHDQKLALLTGRIPPADHLSKEFSFKAHENNSMVASTSIPNSQDFFTFLDDSLFDLSPSKVRNAITGDHNHHEEAQPQEAFSSFRTNMIASMIEPLPLRSESRAMPSSSSSSSAKAKAINYMLDCFFHDPGSSPPSPSVFD